MNGERLAILSINYHSTTNGTDRYAVQLNHPEFPGPLGPPLQSVAVADRGGIGERIDQITSEMSQAELTADFDALDRLDAKLRALGRLLCNTYVPPDIIEILRDLRYPLAISTELNDLPWELLHPGGEDYLALQVPLVRSPVVERYKAGAVRELLKSRQLPVKAVLASNPGHPPLPTASEEVTTLARLLSQARVVVLRMGQDVHDSVDLRGSLSDGQVTILHFTGHGHFDEADPTQSFFRVLTANGQEEKVTAEQLYQSMAGAPVLFLNACELARGVAELRDFVYLAGASKGFANRVIAGGALVFVSAQWPVLDWTACLFALAFYDGLLRTKTLGQALLDARRASARGELSTHLSRVFPPALIPEALTSRVTWANFVVYGRPDKQIVLSDRD